MSIYHQVMLETNISFLASLYIYSWKFLQEENKKCLAKEHYTSVSCFLFAFFFETSKYFMNHYHKDLLIHKFLFLLVVN